MSRQQGEQLRIRSRSLLFAFGPWGVVATLVDPKGRRARLPPGARVCLCTHRPSGPRPTLMSNSKGHRCLGHVGREGDERLRLEAVVGGGRR